jgi:threonine dehydratase
LSSIDLPQLQITPEDLFDPYCDPENPKKISFNDVSAAAYRIKGKVENTPCGVKLLGFCVSGVRNSFLSRSLSFYFGPVSVLTCQT